MHDRLHFTTSLCLPQSLSVDPNGVGLDVGGTVFRSNLLCLVIPHSLPNQVLFKHEGLKLNWVGTEIGISSYPAFLRPARISRDPITNQVAARSAFRRVIELIAQAQSGVAPRLIRHLNTKSLIEITNSAVIILYAK